MVPRAVLLRHTIITAQARNEPIMYAPSTASVVDRSREAPHNMNAAPAHHQPPHALKQHVDPHTTPAAVSSAIDRNSQQHGPDQVTPHERMAARRTSLTPQPTPRSDSINRSIDRPTVSSEPERATPDDHAAIPPSGEASHPPHVNHNGPPLPNTPPQPPAHIITPHQPPPNTAPHQLPHGTVTTC